MRLLGIDEAGRGCILGPLVVGAFLAEGPEQALRDAGADDSKRLSAARRTAARAALRSLGVAETRLISAEAIDRGNLNTLEEDAIVELVVQLRPDRLVLDALGPVRTLAATAERMAKRWRPHGVNPEIVFEPKADAKHPVCGAASIFAKTTRDQLLDDLRPSWGALGSGYPSDPTTRAWLVAHASSGAPWPSFVRTRWATIENLAQGALIQPRGSTSRS